MPTPARSVPVPNLVYRRASLGDLDLAVSILTEAAEWTVNIGGPPTWPRPFPPGILLPSIARGELFLVESGANETMGTVTLQWEDPTFWGEQPPDAGYVHRLAVRRAFAGQGIGNRILGWAEDEVRAARRKFLRLDCAADNPRIRAYYEALGFRFISEVLPPHLAFRCVLYEKNVA